MRSGTLIGIARMWANGTSRVRAAWLAPPVVARPTPSSALVRPGLRYRAPMRVARYASTRF